MIYGELPTVFPWYDDIRKQNRFKVNSEWSCDFKLITPRDALLPFQIKIPYRTNADKSIFDKDNPNNIVTNNRMVVFDGGFIVDNDYQRTIHIPVISNSTLFIKTNEVIPDLLAFYDGAKIFISSIVGNALTEVEILTPANAKYIVVNFSNDKNTRLSDLLMFSITRTLANEVMPGNIVSWKVYTLSGLEININNTVNKDNLHSNNYIDGMRVYYFGEKLVFPSPNAPGTYNDFDLSPGSYYSVIEFENAIYYSEVFTVPNNRFRLNEPNEFMRVDFWNTCDIAPIMYDAGEDSFWKQYVYIDAYVYASDPEIEIDGERDSDDLIVPTFQRMVTKYRFQSLVPDYLKIALVSIQMHDNIELTTENSVRRGKVDRMSTDTAIVNDGAYSSVNVIFDQYVMTKKACCTNMKKLGAANEK